MLFWSRLRIGTMAATSDCGGLQSWSRLRIGTMLNTSESEPWLPPVIAAVYTMIMVRIRNPDHHRPNQPRKHFQILISSTKYLKTAK